MVNRNLPAGIEPYWRHRSSDLKLVDEILATEMRHAHTLVELLPLYAALDTAGRPHSTAPAINAAD